MDEALAVLQLLFTGQMVEYHGKHFDFGKIQMGTTVQQFAEEHLLEKPTLASPRAYAVYRDEYLVGLLDPRQISRIPVRHWPATSVEHAMVPIERATALEPSAPALGALHLILEEGVEQIAVMAEGRLLGLVTRTDLARAQALK